MFIPLTSGSCTSWLTLNLGTLRWSIFLQISWMGFLESWHFWAIFLPCSSLTSLLNAPKPAFDLRCKKLPPPFDLIGPDNFYTWISGYPSFQVLIHILQRSLLTTRISKVMEVTDTSTTSNMGLYKNYYLQNASLILNEQWKENSLTWGWKQKHFPLIIRSNAAFVKSERSKP